MKATGTYYDLSIGRDSLPWRAGIRSILLRSATVDNGSMVVTSMPVACKGVAPLPNNILVAWVLVTTFRLVLALIGS